MLPTVQPKKNIHIIIVTWFYFLGISFGWFLSILFRIPTAHDFRVISARKWARAGTQRKKFPSS